MNEDSRYKKIALRGSAENENIVNQIDACECEPMPLSIKLHVLGISFVMCT